MTSSPGSRLARPPALSPGTDPYPIIPHHSAISHQYPSSSTDQNVPRVPYLLNPRPISHHPGLSPIPAHQVSSPTVLESSQLSSSSTRHAAINSHSARPRTSNQVFSNISDLAAHYGIPQFLPIAPRTTPRRTDTEASSSQPTESFLASPDFANLCSNYLTMLSHQPGVNGANDVPTEGTAPAPTIEVSDADAVQSLLDVFNSSYPFLCGAGLNLPRFVTATPELQMSNDLNEFLTSPLIDSPFDDDLLTTPAVGSDMHADIMTSPLMGDFGGNDSCGEFPPLFDFDPMYEKPSQEESLLFPPPQHFDTLYTLESPNTPLIDSPSTDKTVPSKRKSTVTGTRKNITPATLVPIDAPIQSRKYVTPSATSRKELPATWRRKRLRTSGPDEVDELAEESLVPTATEQEQIEAKRRQNTIAARRSRKRKLEYQRELEESTEQYKRESELWKQRALTCQALLRSHHIECPDFSDS